MKEAPSQPCPRGLPGGWAGQQARAGGAQEAVWGKALAGSGWWAGRHLLQGRGTPMVGTSWRGDHARPRLGSPGGELAGACFWPGMSTGEVTGGSLERGPAWQGTMGIVWCL